MLELTLLANAIWFGMGFHLFALRSNIFAKILVSTAHRETPTFDVLAATLPFLGGFNLSLCVLNLLFLINVSFFPRRRAKNNFIYRLRVSVWFTVCFQYSHCFR